MNELTDAKVAEVILFDAKTVLFRIDLRKHPELANADTVERCMREYTDAYPNVERWSASRNITGWWDILEIIVVGNINLRRAADYLQE